MKKISIYKHNIQPIYARIKYMYYLFSFAQITHFYTETIIKHVNNTNDKSLKGSLQSICFSLTKNISDGNKIIWNDFDDKMN